MRYPEQSGWMKIQKCVPLRAVNTFVWKKMGHTSKFRLKQPHQWPFNDFATKARGKHAAILWISTLNSILVQVVHWPNSNFLPLSPQALTRDFLTFDGLRLSEMESDIIFLIFWSVYPVHVLREFFRLVTSDTHNVPAGKLLLVENMYWCRPKTVVSVMFS